MLHKLGITTKLPVNGKAALEMLALAMSTSDVVFSDIIMPDMSGLELAASIRARHPDLPVLLASGYSDAMRAWEGQRPVEVLGKPYQLIELAEALERSFASTPDN